jgi:N-acetyl sugar amidotransferase
MKRCTRCLMPDTKPGLVLDGEGICQACRHYEKRATTDYFQRYEELAKLCDKHRKTDGSYDCIITVSGGKDSHYQVHIMKDVMGMNPLLVSVVDPLSHTKAGEHNFYNIGDAFGCDIVALHQNPDLIRKMMRVAFKEFGSPTWGIDRAIYTYPLKMAIKWNIPLVIYGENVSWEYGGVLQEETPSAINQINNDVAKKIDWDFWFKNGISEKEIEMLRNPTDEEIRKAKLEPIYLSYFVPWDGYRNFQIAKRYGFRDLTHEWKREGFIEDYDQVDSVAYLVHPQLKYMKFGFARATDVVGYWIRSGKITKEEGWKLIQEHDHKLDQKALDDFLRFTGFTDKEFWEIVDKFYNRDIFKRIDGVWKLQEGGDH